MMRNKTLTAEEAEKSLRICCCVRMKGGLQRYGIIRIMMKRVGLRTRLILRKGLTRAAEVV